MKKIILCMLFVAFTLILFIVIQKKKNTNENIELQISEKKENSVDYIQFKDFNELGLEVAKKNGDWSKLPLSNEFKKKYNERDGIFGDIQFDKVEYKPYNSGKYPFEDYSYLVLTQGLKKTAYIFTMVSRVEGYDIYFGDTIPLTDENGQELEAVIAINENNFTSCIYSLSYGYNDEKSIAVTDHFHKKYPYFLDLFIHYSPLGGNKIELIDSSWENREAYFEVDSDLECIKRRYKVKFFIDENGYLDDAEVKLVGEYPYDKSYLEQAYDSVFYKNSKWDHLKLTDNFRKKYNSYDGVFKDIDLIDYNVNYDVAIYKNNLIVRYKYKNGIHKWFYKKYIYVDDDYLDDVEILPIDYNGENPEEAKEAYIKQYE